jgi:hypothetical protein
LKVRSMKDNGADKLHLTSECRVSY